jgi:hypothetical protein
MPGTRNLLATIAALACLLGGAGGAIAQCMLANPSFEIAGSSGATFGGWSQFGPVGRSTVAPHGSAAARVTGPNTGAWDVSGVWQRMDCAPGQRWAVSVVVSHAASLPLTGESRAIVNLEWRDADGNLISYESHTAADPSTPADRFAPYAFESGPAPAGTAAIHLLLGVLQGPADPAPQVTYDLATCVNLGPPTLESLQWNDFPSGRTVSFSGRTWRVKGPGYYGPGPNLFDHGVNSVWVDALDRLHLTIRKIGSSWYSTEVALDEPLGLGDYVFTTRGRLDLLDRNAVLGLFIWEYGPCYDTGYLWWNPYNEIDVEFSRWGYPTSPIGQFAAQPANWGGNALRFEAVFADSEVTSHAMRWLPDRVEYRSWRGGPDDESPASLIATWTYTGPHIPRPDIPRIHLNLWQLAAPTVTQEVVIQAVTFRPACPDGDCGALAAPAAAAGSPRLAPAVPNPFGSLTRFRFALESRGDVELSVFDTTGRRIRRLVSGMREAGEHAAEWNGRDEAGRRVPPGVYLFRLRTAGLTEARRVVVLD